ncbi:hypothetical protein EVC11_021 [Rhizobium phage RHph_I20]|uniref:Uncharacterized protein n=1 Tax=Rhizobium phage RHph_I20 TaxID=2509730 RepID=A0A7S5V0P4_9CAUD|nr:hypothetical protein EVC11_021 [Rhizobium phage RHph_I20]
MAATIRGCATMKDKKPDPIRFIVSPAKDSRRYELSVFRSVLTRPGLFRLRRVTLGEFHTPNGAKALAAIHAGSQPFRIVYDLETSR